MLIQKLLGFVDLGCEIRAPAAVGVIQQHKLAVLLADLVLVQGALTATVRRSRAKIRAEARAWTYGSSRIRDASRRVIFGSKPLSRCQNTSKAQ